MSRSIAILRFGPSKPIWREAQFISQLSSGNAYSAMGVPFGDIGLISFLSTDLSKKEVYRRYREFFSDTEGCMSLIIMDLDGKGAALLQVDHVTVVAETLRKFRFLTLINSMQNVQSASEMEQEYTVDELLDLISERGLKSLTEKERIRLDILSRDMNSK